LIFLTSLPALPTCKTRALANVFAITLEAKNILEGNEVANLLFQLVFHGQWSMINEEIESSNQPIRSFV
jgi:hypothetical protein